MEELNKARPSFSKRLITTTIAMLIIIVLIVVLILRLVNEKNRLSEALTLSKINREQIIVSENITENMLLVESRFDEYTSTYNREVLTEYNKQVKLLSGEITRLSSLLRTDSVSEGIKIKKLISDKDISANNYLKLRMLVDSLLLTAVSLDEHHGKLEKYYGNNILGALIDTLKFTRSTEYRTKGLWGKIKQAIVGGKIRDQDSTSMLISSQGKVDNIVQNYTEDQMMNSFGKSGVAGGSAGTNDIIRQSLELKKRELALVKTNNRLISEIIGLITIVKNEIKTRETEENNRFLALVKKSEYFLQAALIGLIITALLFGSYILYIAYKNEKYQHEIIVLNEQIVKDSAEKDKLYSVISHDLISPFNTIIGFSDILIDSIGKADQKDNLEYATIISRFAKSTYNLLQNLLTWSRIGSGKINFKPDNTDVAGLVSDAVKLAEPFAAQKNIILQCLSNEPVTWTLDKIMIGSVLQNLLTNAIKFTPPGGAISINYAQKAGNLHFYVSDTGVGLDDEQIEKLFKPGCTSSTRGTNNESGSGFGLIICKEFIEKHNGCIWAENNAYKGSSFHFSVPS